MALPLLQEVRSDPYATGAHEETICSEAGGRPRKDHKAGTGGVRTRTAYQSAPASVSIEWSDGVLTLQGEVEHIAAKKLSMELAIAVHGVSGIVDRLHVVPSTRMGDGAILDAVRDALLQEPTLMNCSIHLLRKGRMEIVREVSIEPHGVIRVSVNEGVVLLDDHVLNLTQKR